MNRIPRYSMLWIVAILSLPILGCSTYYNWEPFHITPTLPKSKLTTIQIDTQGQWLQQYARFGMSINGKRAFQKMIIDNTLSIDDVFVRPGKQDISFLLLTRFYRGEAHQIVDYYSIDVKAGSTYILKGELDDDEVWFELIDTDTDQVVSEYKTSRETTYKTEDDINRRSSEVGWSFWF